MYEEEFLPPPLVETEVEYQPEEISEHHAEIHRTVSRYSDTTVTKRQVIRKHIQVSMVKKLREDEIDSSEEYSSSSEEQPSEEVEFEPMKREKEQVTRTAVRLGGEDVSKRQVIRKREQETEAVVETFEDEKVASDVPRKIEIEEEVIFESPISADVHTEPDIFLGTAEMPGRIRENDEPQVTRVVQRQEEVPVTKRQVIRSVVRETYLTTAKAERSEFEDEEDQSDVTLSSTSSEDNDDKVLDEEARIDGREERHIARTAVRNGQENVTRRQVYRSVETEVHNVIDHEMVDETEDLVDEEKLPEPIVSSQVEVEPEYFEQFLEQAPAQDLNIEEQKALIKRTILRQPDDTVTRRQVIRSMVTETHAGIFHANLEESDKEEDEEVPIAPPQEVAFDHSEISINGVYENGLDEEGAEEEEVVEEDLPRKLGFLRTAVRQGEQLPVTRRQVYRKKVKEITTIDEEVQNQINIGKDVIEVEKPLISDDMSVGLMPLCSSCIGLF